MNTYYIFSDGSHLKSKNGSGRLGAGGILVDPIGAKPFGKQLSSFSIEIIPEYMKLHYGSDDISNPTAEMYAILTALKEFKGSYTDQDLIIVFSDYKGCKEWLDGNWKITKSYIQKIKNEISEIVRKENLNIKFEWIKGHQTGEDNIYKHWNDVVDKLAKGGK